MTELQAELLLKQAARIEVLEERVEALMAQPVMPERLSGELACILEDCAPPEKQSDEAVAALILSYQPMWDRLRASLAPEQDK